MIALVPALALLANRHHSAGYPSWVWWTPPTHITRRDRLNRSIEEILRMGDEKWSDFVVNADREKFEKSNDDELPLAFAEAGTIVFAACLRDRNNKLMARLPASKRFSLRQMRRHLFLYGMACIALEDALAGGGTYAVHEPRYMFQLDEEALYGAMKHQDEDPPASLPLELHKRLCFFSESKKLPPPVLWEREGRLQDVHRYAHYAKTEFTRLIEIGKTMDSSTRKQILTFEGHYLVDYLGVRGADGRPCLPKKKLKN